MKTHQHICLASSLCFLICAASAAPTEVPPNAATPEEPVVSEEYYKNIYKRLLGRSAYTDIHELEEGPLDLDFSPIWMVRQLNFGQQWPSNQQIREPLGYIGDHFQRLQIRFTSIAQRESDPTVYDVAGKTRVKGHICDFKGTLTLKYVRLAKVPIRYERTEQDQEALYNGTPVRPGVVVGEYKLVEDPAQLRSGILTGMFATNFVMTDHKDVWYATADFQSDHYRNNQFEGIWTSHRYGMIKVCNWGNHRIPNSEGLDIGAGEFSPSDRALPYGWQTYRNAYYVSTGEDSKTALQKEEEAWWEDEVADEGPR
ncbi:MAG: hypothetical protein AAFP93_01920 [Bacteroidota bacterium]